MADPRTQRPFSMSATITPPRTSCPDKHSEDIQPSLIGQTNRSLARRGRKEAIVVVVAMVVSIHAHTNGVRLLLPPTSFPGSFLHELSPHHQASPHQPCRRKRARFPARSAPNGASLPASWQAPSLNACAHARCRGRPETPCASGWPRRPRSRADRESPRASACPEPPWASATRSTSSSRRCWPP
jgi:hypothetical protein